jgi:biotin operon repressor
MTTVTTLLNALASHQGRDAGIQAERLADQLGVPLRRLRKLISEAREDGIAICGKPASGYFMPVTPEELQETCAFLEHRALHSLRKLSRMKKVALPVLLGQLLLNQA